MAEMKESAIDRRKRLLYGSGGDNALERTRNKMDALQDTEERSMWDQAKTPGGILTGGLALAALLAGEEEAALGLGLGGLQGLAQGADRYNAERAGALEQADANINAALEKRTSELTTMAINNPDIAVQIPNLNNMLGYEAVDALEGWVTKRDMKIVLERQLLESEKIESPEARANVQRKIFLDMGFDEEDAEEITSLRAQNTGNKEMYETTYRLSSTDYNSRKAAERVRLNHPKGPESPEAYEAALQELHGIKTQADVLEDNMQLVVEAKNRALEEMNNFRLNVNGGPIISYREALQLISQEARDNLMLYAPGFIAELEANEMPGEPAIYKTYYDQKLPEGEAAYDFMESLEVDERVERMLLNLGRLPEYQRAQVEGNLAKVKQLRAEMENMSRAEYAQLHATQVATAYTYGAQQEARAKRAAQLNAQISTLEQTQNIPAVYTTHKIAEIRQELGDEQFRRLSPFTVIAMAAKAYKEEGPVLGRSVSPELDDFIMHNEQLGEAEEQRDEDIATRSERFGDDDFAGPEDEDDTALKAEVRTLVDQVSENVPDGVLPEQREDYIKKVQGEIVAASEEEGFTYNKENVQKLKNILNWKPRKFLLEDKVLSPEEEARRHKIYQEAEEREASRKQRQDVIIREESEANRKKREKLVTWATKRMNWQSDGDPAKMRELVADKIAGEWAYRRKVALDGNEEVQAQFDEDFRKAIEYQIDEAMKKVEIGNTPEETWANILLYLIG